MLRFILRRLLYSIPVLIGIVVAVFLLARILPGDVCRATLGERATEEVCESFKEENGLNENIFVQFGVYAGNLLTGDLGESLQHRRSVQQLMIERLPVTLQLSVAALLLAIMIGIPAGVLAGYRHNSATDVAAVVGSNLGVSIPVFVLGLFLQFIFAKVLADTFLALPPSGQLTPGVIPEPFYEAWGLPPNDVFEFISNIDTVNTVLTLNWEVLWDAIRHLVLPAITLATIPIAIIVRMTRSSLLDTLGLDYVRTARAKGLRERVVVGRHALRNSLLPVVTVIGLSLGTLLGGAILTETIFSLTGVGKTLFDAIAARDYTVIQGFTLVIAVVFVLINLMTDIIYTYLDPKVRVT